MQDIIAILRHSGGLLMKKVTETVIVRNNGKITEWIEREIATEGIQSSGTRISNNITDQVNIQEINNIIISDYNTILI